jgi:hypothetical protein
MPVQFTAGRFTATATGTGLPLIGGLLYTYQAGTSTPQATYTDYTLGTPNTNPIVLNARGEASVWLGSNTYKFVLQDSFGNPIWTADGVADTTAQFGGALASSDNGSGADLVGGVGRVVSTITAMRALSKSGTGKAFVLGYYAAGDGGGGQYYYDPTDNISTDNGGTIIVASDGGRWKLVTSAFITGKQFGIKADGATDDTASLQAFVTYLVSQSTVGSSTWGYSGQVVGELPPGYIKISGTINVTGRLTLRGAGSSEFSSGTRITQTVANTDTFKFVASGGGASFEISDIAFTTSGAGAAAGSGHFINVQPSTPGFNSNRINRCFFQNPQSMAIRIAGDDYQIADCTFDVSGLSGNCIQLGSNTANDVVSNVAISNCDFFNIVTHCILGYQCRDLAVFGNRVSQPNAVMQTIAFVDFSDSGPLLATGINISGNVVYGIRRFFGGNTVSSVNIVGNTSYNGGVGAGEIYDVILLQGTNTNVVIADNVFQGAYGNKNGVNNQGGASLTNAVIVNNVFANSSAGSGTGLLLGAMVGQIGNGNIISGFATKISANDFGALGYANFGLQSPAYSASIAIDASAGNTVLIIVANNSAFTINAPTNPSNGQLLTIQIYNNSGGAMGAITWAAAYHMAAFSNPGSVQVASITFSYSSGLGHWTEVSRSSSSIPG